MYVFHAFGHIINTQSKATQFEPCITKYSFLYFSIGRVLPTYVGIFYFCSKTFLHLLYGHGQYIFISRCGDDLYELLLPSLKIVFQVTSSPKIHNQEVDLLYRYNSVNLLKMEKGVLASQPWVKGEAIKDLVLVLTSFLLNPYRRWVDMKLRKRKRFCDIYIR